jgi:tetratricopeptide (TPR) repeat protein
MCAQTNDYPGAARWWERVAKAQEHAMHYVHLAHSLACLGDLDYASEICRKAVEVDDRNAQCYLQWGEILEALDKHREAIQKYQMAALLDSASRAVYLRRIAEAWFVLHRYPDALSACAQAQTYDPASLDIPYLRMKVSLGRQSAETPC